MLKKNSGLHLSKNFIMKKKIHYKFLKDAEDPYRKFLVHVIFVKSIIKNHFQ